MNLADAIDIGSLVDDEEAIPGLDMRFEQGVPPWTIRRDWNRDAEFEKALRGHLLEP